MKLLYRSLVATASSTAPPPQPTTTTTTVAASARQERQDDLHRSAPIAGLAIAIDYKSVEAYL